MQPLLAMCLPALVALSPQPKSGTVEVLVIGVFHFDSPGLDMFNTKVRDILGDRRQKEILELVKRLETYKPTKIAVEAPYGSATVQNRLDKFLADDYQLKSNEIDQVALRLAKSLGHKKIYSIDFKQDMDMDAVFAFAKANGQDAIVQNAIQEFAAKIQPLIAEESLERTSILKILEDMNNFEFERIGNGMYMTFLRIGRDDKYPGAELVAGWHARNLKITTNVIRIADSPDDRILLIIGAGHAPLIRQILNQTPGFKIRSAAEFLKP